MVWLLMASTFFNVKSDSLPQWEKWCAEVEEEIGEWHEQSAGILTDDHGVLV